VDIAEIAAIISKDPALSSKILRTVNSSFYGRSQNVSTISHALVILGLQSVKTLVLSFSLVTNLSKSKSKGFKHIIYWKRSIYAATAARSLAAKLGLVQQEEAFLAALLQDIGMLVLDQVIGEKYGELHARTKSHSELPLVESESLGMTHADVGGILTQQWKLPPLLSVPVASHHTAEHVSDPALRGLAQLICISSRCADVFVDEDAAPAIADVRKLLAANYQLKEADADALLNEVGTRTKETASLFEISIGSTTDYEAILKRANETLVEITLQSQLQTTQLQQLTQVLKQKAETDGLTGLANRAMFDQFLAEQFQDSIKQKKNLALLILDLDKFKLVNDRFGHPAGDAVIKAVARLLKSAARPQDLAARYGGEEMCLVLPGTARPIASAIAESIRRAIAARPVIFGQNSIPMTASIGVVAYEPGSPFTSAAHLIKAADLGVYNAKNAGRNCVKIFSFKSTTPSAAVA
ncbi:MAG TPA: GGDEF domain-containing protein, partial [Tepidisphaeraceae bacterium]|nr:GGDEF domain-containing protein [Tepidisphaeraceae bacterium]